MARSGGAALLLALVLAGPAAVAKVTVDFDPAVDFSRYGTFALESGTPSEDPEVERRIRVAVERELIAAGFKEVREDADLLVLTHAAVEGERQIEIGDYPYWRDHVGWKRPAATRAEVWLLAAGTVVVDLLDAESGRLVWRGLGTENVAKNAEKRDHKLNQAIAEMFKRFPPK